MNISEIYHYPEFVKIKLFFVYMCHVGYIKSNYDK